MARPRLAVVIPSLHGAGCERMVAALLPDFQARFDVHLILHRAAIAYPIPPSVPIHLLQGDASPDHHVAYKAWRFAQRATRLATILRRERYDAVLGFVDVSNVLTAYAHALAGSRARLVLAEHTVNPQFFRFNPHARRLRPLLQALLRVAYTRAHRVIVISRAMQRYLRQGLGIWRPTDLIYNGVDTDVFYPRRAADEPCPRLEPAYTAPGVRLLSVGRLDANKDHAFLVRLLPDLLAALPDARLFLLGVGPEETALRRLACALGLADRVVLLGWRENVADYLRRADVFLIASHYESFSNATVEALACGTPVVVTRASAALPEVLAGGRYGAVVPLGDSATYARAVIETVQRRAPDREYRAEIAAYARGRFDLRETRARYVQVVEEASSV
jgi:glycosyltransferase involved in cell wall biosynthesis